MANQPVTPQELIDAGTDCGTIEDAVNGAPEVEITSRLGRKFWTLATFDSRSQQLLSEFRDAVQTIVTDDGVPAQVVQVGDSTLDVFANDVKFTNETVENIAPRLTAQDRQKLKNRDRTLDITDYIKSIILEYESKRTDADDTYSNAQGLVKILLPKGVYTIRPNEIKISGAYGFMIEGDGVTTTAILCKSDSGAYFDFTPYLYVTFKNLSIIHQPQNSDKSTWTNSLFKLNGYGGGRRFKTDNVLVVGFNRVIDFVSQNNANEDTTYSVESLFSHCNTFIYSRSSQAVNNSFTRCSWYGDIKKVFDVSNYGHTHISDSGVVIAGAFFSLASHTGFYGKTAQFVMTNVKFEWLKSDLTNTNATTKIIETADDPTISAYFKLINCGIAGGSPSVNNRAFDIKAGSFILDVQGGEWANVRIATKAQTTTNIKDVGYLKFSGCAVAPLRNIDRIGGVSGAIQKPVIFENCADTDNIAILSDGLSNGASVVYTTKNINRVSSNSGRLITGNTTQTLSVQTYGQLVSVLSVELFIKGSETAQNAVARLYADAAKTTLISEVAIPSQAQPQVLKLETTGVLTSEGVFVEISQDNQNGAIIGSITTESLSF